MRKRCINLICLFFTVGLLIAADGRTASNAFLKWSQAEAVEVLNRSPWSRTVTFTRVVPGIGSGVSGEKEIYNAFYVRFLSARPIREAYTRIQLIKYGYDKLSQGDRSRFSTLIEDRVAQDYRDWVVVVVSFRSNDPNQESVVRKYFASQTSGTLMNRAFLSTDRFPQVRLEAYYPPGEEEVGARFVFPRSIEGAEILSKEDNQIVFELTEMPGASLGGNTQREKKQKRGSASDSEEAQAEKSGILRASFPADVMVVNDELVY